MKKTFKLILVLALAAIVIAFGVVFSKNDSISKEETGKTTITETTTTQPETVVTTDDTNADNTATNDEVKVTVKVDKLSGKTYYESTEKVEDVVKYIRKNVTATEAVSAIECQELGASMVVSFDDSRIVKVDGKVFTAYDLYCGGSLKVTFDRNGATLYACEEGRDFGLSDDKNMSFATFDDDKAYETWVCTKHDAIYRSVLVFEGYPESEGYKGTFDIKRGFDARVLESIVLLKVGNRYEWVFAVCDCGEESKDCNNGGSYVPGRPTVKPTEEPTTEEPTTEEPTTEEPTTEEPTETPTEEPTNEPAHEPESTLPPKQTSTPAHEAESTLPPNATTDSTPTHSTEGTLGSKVEPDSSVSAQPTLPPKQESGSSSSSGPNLGGITW